MLDQACHRTQEFQRRLKDEGIEIAIITDESSIACLAGFWGYLSVDFGRPAFSIVRPEEDPIVITPAMESEMVSAMTWVSNVQTWEDFGANRWENVLATSIGSKTSKIAVELGKLPALVRNWFDASMPGTKLID